MGPLNYLNVLYYILILRDPLLLWHVPPKALVEIGLYVQHTHGQTWSRCMHNSLNYTLPYLRCVFPTNTNILLQQFMSGRCSSSSGYASYQGSNHLGDLCKLLEQQVILCLDPAASVFVVLPKCLFWKCYHIIFDCNSFKVYCSKT